MLSLAAAPPCRAVPMAAGFCLSVCLSVCQSVWLALLGSQVLGLALLGHFLSWGFEQEHHSGCRNPPCLPCAAPGEAPRPLGHSPGPPWVLGALAAPPGLGSGPELAPGEG